MIANYTVNNRAPIMAALRGETVPPCWVETYLSGATASRLPNYEFSLDWGYNGSAIDEHLLPAQPLNSRTLKRWRAEIDRWIELLKRLGIGAIGMHFWPPVFVGMLKNGDGMEVEGEGLIKSVYDLRYWARKAPDPLDDSRYDLARELVERGHAAGLAVFFNSAFILEIVHREIGFERFCFALHEEMAFLRTILDWYCEYEMKLLGKLSGLGADFLWISDDCAYKSGPFISPDHYRSLFMPYYRKLCRQITVPWILHTDGNISPLIPDMLGLGMSALHPLEKGAMDLDEVCRRYGREITLVGNVAMDVLIRGEPEHVEKEVLELHRVMHASRHIYSSGNCLVEAVRPENILAMSEAIQSLTHRNS
jgi:hypothetical protein